MQMMIEAEQEELCLFIKRELEGWLSATPNCGMAVNGMPLNPGHFIVKEPLLTRRLREAIIKYSSVLGLTVSFDGDTALLKEGGKVVRTIKTIIS